MLKINIKPVYLISILLISFLVFSLPQEAYSQNKIKRNSKMFKKSKIKPPKNMTKEELDPEETDFAKTLTYLLDGHYFKPKDVKAIKKIIDKTTLTKEEKAALHMGMYNLPMSSKEVKLYKQAAKKRIKAKESLDKFSRKLANRKIKNAKKTQMNQGNLHKKVNKKAKRKLRK